MRFVIGPVFVRKCPYGYTVYRKDCPSAVLKLQKREVVFQKKVDNEVFVVVENGKPERFALFFPPEERKPKEIESLGGVQGPPVSPEVLKEKVEKITGQKLEYKMPEEVISEEAQFILKEGKYNFIARALIGKDEEGARRWFYMITPPGDVTSFLYLAGKEAPEPGRRFVYVGPFSWADLRAEKGKLRAGPFLLSGERIRSIRRKDENFWLGIAVNELSEEDWRIISKSTLPPDDSSLEKWLCVTDESGKIVYFRAQGTEEEYEDMRIPERALVGRKIYILGETKEGTVIACFDLIRRKFEGPFVAATKGDLWIKKKELDASSAAEIGKIRIYDVVKLISDYSRLSFLLEEDDLSLLAFAEALIARIPEFQLTDQEIEMLEEAAKKDSAASAALMRLFVKVEIPAGGAAYYTDKNGRSWLLRPVGGKMLKKEREVAVRNPPRRGSVWIVDRTGHIVKIYRAREKGGVVYAVR